MTRPAGTAGSGLSAALDALHAGRPVGLLDDLVPAPAAAGAIVVAGDRIDTATMALLVRVTSGVVAVAAPAERLDALRIPPMPGGHGDPGRPGFAVAVDLATGITTGISARDRSATVRALADPSSSAEAFTRPGHVLPVRSRDGGVLARARPAEAAMDLCRAAGREPVAALATAVDDAGGAGSAAVLESVAARHPMPLVRVSEVLSHRRAEIARVLGDLGAGRGVLIGGTALGGTAVA
ncbi:hypothetical protein GCM10009613_19460 [Pseudonocardia kongjuensis]|uniref:3,4-dihydroxy-2-butanone-4-phosphate synthase n=1 Tax=Pseudonocardia kongjuensis TaxID=102227 RepID=A0ABP4IFG8_9PSEU